MPSHATSNLQEELRNDIIPSQDGGSIQVDIEAEQQGGRQGIDKWCKEEQAEGADSLVSGCHIQVGFLHDQHSTTSAPGH
jgi:hypothetical protein